MTISEAVREHHEPLAEVWIGHTPYPDEHERLIIGESNPYVLRQQREISEQPLQRIPVKPRSAGDLLDWIKSQPAELNRALESALREVLTRGILERYPPTPEEREVCCLSDEVTR